MFVIYLSNIRGSLQGVLKGFLTFMDTLKVGYRFHNIYIKLKVLSEKREREIIDKLKRLPSVCWLISTAGHYNLVVCILAKDVQEFREAQNDIMGILENCIVEDSVFIVLDACQLPYPLLPNQPRTFDQKHVSIGGQQVKVQPIDLKILQELAGNARITTLELAQKLKTSMRTVGDHLDRLLDSDLVQGYKPLIDMTKIGKEWYFVLFRLKYVDNETRKRFLETLKAIPQTFFVVNGVGNWGMQCEFYCDNDKEFKEVLNKIFPSEKSEIIKEHTELRILEEHKCLFYPASLAMHNYQASLDVWFTTHAQKTKQETLAEE